MASSSSSTRISPLLLLLIVTIMMATTTTTLLCHSTSTTTVSRSTIPLFIRRIPRGGARGWTSSNNPSTHRSTTDDLKSSAKEGARQAKGKADELKHKAKSGVEDSIDAGMCCSSNASAAAGEGGGGVVVGHCCMEDMLLHKRLGSLVEIVANFDR